MQGEVEANLGEDLTSRVARNGLHAPTDPATRLHLQDTVGRYKAPIRKNREMTHFMERRTPAALATFKKTFIIVSILAFVMTSEAQICVPLPTDAVSWWGAESNALDNLGINNGTLVGSPSFAAGKVGLAFNFDGSSQYIDVPDSPSLHFASGMTAEAWVYPTQAPSHDYSIMVKYDSVGGVNQSSFSFSIAPDSKPYIILSIDGTQGAVNLKATNICPLNTWTHLAATYDGSSVKIYFNGSLQTSTPLSGDIFPGTDDLGIGANIGGGGVTGVFLGRIDEPTLYSRALSAGEIQAIYNAGSTGKCGVPPIIASQPVDQTVTSGATATFMVAASGGMLSYQWSLNHTNIAGATNAVLTLVNAQINQAGTYSVMVSNQANSASSSDAVLTVNPLPPCYPAPSNIVSWWSAENNALDNLGTNNGTLMGSPAFVPGKVGTAFNFNGSSQYVRIPDSPSLHFSSGFTAEAWVYPTQNFSHDFSILVKYDSIGAANQSSFSFSIAPDAKAYIILSTDGTQGAVNLKTASSCPTNMWTHLAATYDGSTVSIYFNGSLENSTSLSGNMFPGTDALGIGANIGEGGSGAVFAGRIDEPTLYNRALSSDEIQAIYNADSGGKCAFPPFITAQPSNLIVTIGDNAIFAAAAAGTPNLSYQWRLNQTNISGATNLVLSLTNVQFNQAGAYSLLVSNKAGSALSTNAILTVNPLPPCDVAPSNIVSWWAAESNALDNVGGNNGVLFNQAGFAAGKVGRAFSFTSSGQHVRIADAPNLRFSNAMTAEAWVYPTSEFGSGNSILVKYDGVQGINQSAFSFSINGSNGFGYLTVSSNGTPAGSISVSTTNGLPLNGWTHLAATYDGAALKIYFNGSLQNTVAFSGNIFPGTDDLGIGGNVGGEPQGTSVGPFAGMIDEPSLYNRALSATEILNIYNAGLSGKCAVQLAPAVYAQPPGTLSLPAGSNATFTAFATGSPVLNYQWKFNGVTIPGATNRSLTLTNIQPTNAGNYTLLVSNALNSALSSASRLNVKLVTVIGNGQTLTNTQYAFTNSVTIQLKNYYTNGYVFYTLDGTTPTAGSTLYSGSFLLMTNAIIQTIAYSPDFQQSAVSDPIAILIPPTYTLTATSAGGGAITLNPTGPSYTSNTVVGVTATPSNGWFFLQWQGDISGLNPTNTVLMSRNKSVQAVFGTTVSNTVGGNGTVIFNPPGGIYPFGTTLQASALPSPGNVLVLWGSAASGNTNPLSFFVNTPAPVISALFTSLGGGQVSLAAVPLGHGQVSVNPRANGYMAGQSVTLTATPDAGKTFKGWSGDASGTQNPLLVTLNTSKIIYANFSTNNSLDVHSGPGRGLSEGVEVDINGELGTHYRLETSTNLTNWTPLLNVTDFVGTVHFIDAGASNLNRRFYRSVILP